MEDEFLIYHWNGLKFTFKQDRIVVDNERYSYKKQHFEIILIDRGPDCLPIQIIATYN